jgi:hypothetical protein
MLNVRQDTTSSQLLLTGEDRLFRLGATRRDTSASDVDIGHIDFLQHSIGEAV